MIQVCVFTQRRIKSWGVCGTHLASVTPDLGWTSYLDPWGSSFPSAGRVMLSLQSACQDQHSQLKTFPHLTVSVCFAFPTKWFSTIYSIALVLIGGASWGRTLPTFANVSTNLASAKLRGRGIRSFTSSRKWKEILKSVVWSGVSVFPSVTQSLLRKSSDHDVPALDFSQIWQILWDVSMPFIWEVLKKRHLWQIYNCYMFVQIISITCWNLSWQVVDHCLFFLREKNESKYK